MVEEDEYTLVENGSVDLAKILEDDNYRGRVVDVFENIKRQAVLENKHSQYFTEIIYKKLKREKLIQELMYPSSELIEFFSKHLNIEQAEINEMWVSVVDIKEDVYKREENKFEEQFKNTNESMLDNDMLDLLYNRRNKMMGNSSNARRAREGMKKYLTIWEALLNKQSLTMSQLKMMLEGLISTKGNSQFFKTYIGEPSSDKILVLEKGKNYVYINPFLEKELKEMVELIKGER